MNKVPPTILSVYDSYTLDNAYDLTLGLIMTRKMSDIRK